jgi:CheY-like chemotaxis protein
MDIASLSTIGLKFVAAGLSLFPAEVTKECITPAVRFAVDRLRERIQRIFGGQKQADGEIDPELLRDKRIRVNAEIAMLSEELIENYSSLRRAKHFSSFLDRASILWVDDRPDNNINQVRVLELFGIRVEQAVSTSEALNRLVGWSFDLILSDIDREARADAGMELLLALRSSDCPVPLVFYVGKADPNRGVPVGAFGIADQPEPLIHLVLDVLERRRI